MHLNNWLIFILYIPSIILYLGYFISFDKKSTIIFQQKKYINRLILCFSLGTILAIITGYFYDKFPSDLATIDIIRMINFLLIFIIPPVLTNSRIIKNRFILKIFHLFLFVLVITIGFSLLTGGMGSSAFYGNVFGATTVNLTLTSIIAFYGVFYYYVHKSIFGLIIALLSWFLALASLAKWNFWIDIMIPILLVKIFMASGRKKVIHRLFISLTFIIILLTVILPNLQDYLNVFANLHDYSSFDNYLNSRVLRSVTSDNMAVSGTLFNFGGEGISDGARFAMWQDLISRTFENPIFGLGFGTRAFANQGLNIEDHSFLVFFISRFGLIIATFIVYYISKALRKAYGFFKDENYPLLKYLYFGIIGNFFFQGSVGMIWGQLPVTLLLGVILSLMFSDAHVIKQYPNGVRKSS